MYNVQNTSNKNVPIPLEKGGVILTPGQYFDLERYCSREWIAENHDLKVLTNAGLLRVAHDSAHKVPQTPVRKVNRTPARAELPPPEVKIVDLSDVDDISVEAVSDSKVSKKVEAAPAEKLHSADDISKAIKNKKRKKERKKESPKAKVVEDKNVMSEAKHNLKRLEDPVESILRGEAEVGEAVLEEVVAEATVEEVAPPVDTTLEKDIFDD